MLTGFSRYTLPRAKGIDSEAGWGLQPTTYSLSGLTVRVSREIIKR